MFTEQAIEIAAVVETGEVGYQGDGIAGGAQQVGGITETVVIQEIVDGHAVTALADGVCHILVVRA